jgi:hypothetical protein
MALTPDGSQLLATNLLDGSLSVINPDNPASTFAILVLTPITSSSTCTIGPLYVAATSNSQAFITTGGLPGPGCPAEGNLYIANLSTRTVATPPQVTGCSVSSLYPALRRLVSFAAPIPITGGG